MSLQKYWNKRDFEQTPEPRGKVAKNKTRLGFFIQKHAARRLHYDFRLELDGTLKSWAVPKGPSLNPADKRLAVHVEDHPLDYGTFEGIIPPNQYGAGTVLLWDKGIWMPQGNAREGYRKGHLKFQLEGEKLSGGWALVRMGKPAQQGKENWLLIKEHDAQARSGKDANIIALRPESVLTGSKEISADDVTVARYTSDRAAHDNKKMSGRKTASGHKSITDPSMAAAEVAGARKKTLPGLIKPQLATLTERAPEGEGWLCEVKFDGYRALARVDRTEVALYTRAGHDWTAKWQSIAEALSPLASHQAWLDGEVVALDEQGKISFQALQNFARDGRAAPLVYYVFDLIYLDGFDLSEAPLLERKRLLRMLLATMGDNPHVVYNDHVVGDAADILEHACMHGLEGIIVKRADGRYLPTRSRSWLKLKCRHRQEFVIGGYTNPGGSRTGFGAILLGVYDEQQQLRYAGRVGTGFDEVNLTRLLEKFSAREIKTAPFKNPPTGADARGVHWMRPDLVAEINFAEWTGDGRIRQGSFVALRDDKLSKDIVQERPLSKSAVRRAERDTAQRVEQPAAKVKKQPAASAALTVAGINISHPSRILFPGAQWTKADLAHYYENVADWILPHLRQRPLTLVRCPQGGGAHCFFQKNVNETVPDEIGRIEVPEDQGKAIYMLANDVPALISLVQIGVLELHTWGSHQGKLEYPDRIIFDLDPAPGLPWPRVVEAAQLIRALLGEVGLTSFVKTTGGKGLHIALPIKPERTWTEVKAFTKAIAEHLAQTLPDRFTANISKAKRTDKIFVDYLRNGLGATAVAAFSTRARPNAPVSVPLAWEELERNVRSDSFNLANIHARLSALRADPWEEYFSLKQRITSKMLKSFDLAS